MRNAGIHPVLVIDAPDWAKNPTLNTPPRPPGGGSRSQSDLLGAPVLGDLLGAERPVHQDSRWPTRSLNYPLIVGEFSQSRCLPQR